MNGSVSTNDDISVGVPVAKIAAVAPSVPATRIIWKRGGSKMVEPALQSRRIYIPWRGYDAVLSR
jgi:hypothetical protein